MLDAHHRRLAGYPRYGTLLEEALELIQFESIAGWTPYRDAKGRPKDSAWLG